MFLSLDVRVTFSRYFCNKCLIYGIYETINHIQNFFFLSFILYLSPSGFQNMGSVVLMFFFFFFARGGGYLMLTKVAFFNKKNTVRIVIL